MRIGLIKSKNKFKIINLGDSWAESKVVVMHVFLVVQYTAPEAIDFDQRNLSAQVELQLLFHTGIARTYRRLN